MPDVAVRPTVGPLLRTWRTRRRLSQLDLALEAGVSARHLSFVETGRSRPSAEMVLHLAEQLDVPLRDRNRLLLAAGYAPAYGERDLEDPEMTPVREALDLVLGAHDPYPAIVVDRAWNLVAGNRGLGLLTAEVDPALLAPPANCIRLALHPYGLAPRIANLSEWRAHLLERLRRQIALTADAQVAELLEEMEGYPGGDDSQDGGAHTDYAGAIVVPFRMHGEDGELTFFSTVATFGTAVDITLAELSVESFFPADQLTAHAVREFARTA
jgi:transcriptional regulator with XRE-family HTH domain